MKPYKDKILNENTRIRYFEQGATADQMVWHRDQYDRIIEAVECDGWLFQRDNDLPVPINIGESIEITAGEWHRLIPGDTRLVIIITEKNKMKITRRQLKRIIKEVLSESGNMRANVSQMDAQRIFAALSGQGRLRRLTRGDELDADEFIRANVVRWQTTREATIDMIDWLVSKRFGNLMDYR